MSRISVRSRLGLALALAGVVTVLLSILPAAEGGEAEEAFTIGCPAAAGLVTDERSLDEAVRAGGDCMGPGPCF